MSKNLFKSTTIVAGMTMISRVFGFLRDMVTAHIFGADAAVDAFTVAFKIPNFMRRLFAEGSFSQAFVPVLSEYQQQKPHDEIRRFLSAMSGTLGFILLATTVCGIIFAPWIIRAFAPGFDTTGPRYDLAVTMLRVTFPYLMLISLTAFSGAILNTYNQFWVFAFTPVFLNISMIVAAIWLAPHMVIPITALAWGVFIAGVVQLLFQWPFLRRLRLMPWPTINFRDPGVKKVLKLMIPALFGVSVSQINLLMDTLFASFLVVGSLSWLYFSDRLMEFPLGVIGVAISTVILPHLSRHHASKSVKDFSLVLDWAVRCIILLGLPAAVVFAFLSGPLLSTLLQYGHFDGYAVTMASKSLSMFAIGIVPFMLIKVLAAGFYARQDLRTPVRIGIVAMLANILFNCILIWPFKHAGIALATSLSAVLNMGCLYYFLIKHEIYTPRDGWRHFALRIVGANVLLAVWLKFAAGDLAMWIAHPAVWRVSYLLGLLFSALVVYVVGLWIVGVRVGDLLTPVVPKAL